MDGPGGDHLWEVFDKIGRVVVRYIIVRVVHVRAGAVPGHARQGRYRADRTRLSDEETGLAPDPRRYIQSHDELLGRDAREAADVRFLNALLRGVQHNVGSAIQGAECGVITFVIRYTLDDYLL